MDDDLSIWMSDRWGDDSDGVVEEEMVKTQSGGLLAMPSSLTSHTCPPGGQPPLPTHSSQQARANVVREIISAEREYVKHLNDVVEVRNAHFIF